MRLFFTRTPRGTIEFIKLQITILKQIFFLDFAELNAPPMINYGAVYPQAILVFVITLLYSVIQPLILIFGAIYFGVSYIVYKYKLLFGECSLALFQRISSRMQSFTSLTNPKAKHGP